MFEEKGLNHIDRVLCAFEHEEPDKVPKGEWFIDPALLVKLIGKSSGDQFIDLLHVWEMLNMDIKATKGGYEIEEVIGEDEEGRKIFRDYWRCMYKESGVGLLTPGLLESPIKDIDEVYDYEFPSFDEFKTDEIKKWAEITDYFIFAVVSGGFEQLTSLVGGYEKYMIYAKIKRRELKYLIKRYTQYQAELAKKYIRAGAHAIIIADDLAYNSGPFLSPVLFREILFPYLKEEVRAIKNFRDVPVIFHSDGNINLLLDDIVELRIDGIHPLEKHAGVDIVAVKKKYGDHICLMGNVDTSYTLPYGTPQEVEEEVKKLIEAVAPGGGFILRASNLLTSDIPQVNVLAMYYAAEKYGVYKKVAVDTN